MLRNPYIKWTFVLVCIVFFISCSSDDDSNHINHLNPEFSNSNSLTYCSPLIGDLSARMETYEFQGNLYEETVELRFTQNIDLQGKILSFYRWSQNSNGIVSSLDGPLSFYREINGQLISGCTDPSQEQPCFTNITQSGPSGADLSQTVIVIPNLPFTFQALQIILADEFSGETIDSSNGLLPPYKAHPGEYNRKHPNKIALQGLHPYSGESESPASEQDFVDRAHSDFCL